MSNDERSHRHTDEVQPRHESAGKQWHNLDDFVDDPNFEKVMVEKFPREAAILKRSGMSRRSFMSLMGASLVMGGLSLTGCAPASRGEEIIPYVQMPEEIVPGRPLYFASAMVLNGYATGMLIETHEGRPTRVEGNPQHPASMGSNSAIQLASILELYNPARATSLQENGEARSWDDFSNAFESIRERLGEGDDLLILTELVTSPAMAARLEALQEQYPSVRWYQYDPIGYDNIFEGSRLAFGEVLDTVYDFSQANVVLSLDNDFLMNQPGSLRYAHDFASMRKVSAGEGDASMNRLYAVESTPGNTGAIADHRLSLRAGDVALFALALADALGVEGGRAISDAPWDDAWFNTVVEDLQANNGASIVTVGAQQPAAVHALVHAINDSLGNSGTTVNYLPTAFANPVNTTENLRALVDDINEGGVDALFILGGNPVYTAPKDIDFVAALERVLFSAHVSPYYDETSENCTWHIPRAHYIESWGDARAYDGTVSIIQPPIGTLYEDARSDMDMLAFIADDGMSGYDFLRAYWEDEFSGDDFVTFWQNTLNTGVMADSAPEPASPSLSSDYVEALDALSGSGDGLEIIFRPHPNVLDGRFSYNTWLLELPDALTKLTWDMVAMMSSATAVELGVDSGEIINLTLNGRTMQAPVWVMPGHPDNAITVSLGFGHGLTGDVEADLSFNAYDLRTSENLWFASGVTVQDTGDNYRLARTQKVFESFGTDPVRQGTLSDYIDNPNFAHDGEKKYDANFLSEFDYDGYAWGMSIDLTTCTGCNACIIGCQSENNIPSVGKAEVLQERDMHWLRVDLYLGEDGDTYAPDFQPVPCMHCENAPCEQVCPVQATVHDHEGLNQMVYNRCIGTRSCGANCPYAVRRFNYKDYIDDAPILVEQRNPDVTVRSRGVMEKCTYCVQRINAARITSSNEDRRIMDGEVMPACAAACPTQAIKFGNINDPEAAVTREKAQPTSYGLLEEINTFPRTTYLARLTNPNDALQGDDSAAEADEEG